MIEISFDADLGYVLIRVPVADWPPLLAPELEKAEGTNAPTKLKRDLRGFVLEVNRLQRKKARLYRDSWIKRGEVLGAQANIARKIDRVEECLNDPAELYECLVDALVYTELYRLWMVDYAVGGSVGLGLTRNPDGQVSVYPESMDNIREQLCARISHADISKLDSWGLSDLPAMLDGLLTDLCRKAVDGGPPAHEAANKLGEMLFLNAFVTWRELQQKETA